jgi:hypothetical protein
MARVIALSSGSGPNPLTFRVRLAAALAHPWQTMRMIRHLRRGGRLEGDERRRYMERLAGQLAAEGRLTSAELPDETGRLRRY